MKLINWDCLEELKKMESESIDFVLTDVPYNISKKNNFKSLKDANKKDWESEYKWIDFWEWDKNTFDLEWYIKWLLRVMKDWTSAFVWCSYQQLSLIEDYYRKYCPKSKQWAVRIWVWKKTNPAFFNMDKMPVNPFEFGIWFRKASKWTFNKRKDWKYTTLFWETPYASWPHPTQKRVDICEELIETFSNKWDIVLDLVAGVWTTWIAAKNKGRDFIINERDINYFNIAKERIN